MLWAMVRSKSKSKKAKKASNGTKSRPRTVRLPLEDEKWVDEQAPQSFSSVLCDAVRFYREHQDTQRKALLEAVA